VTAIAVGAVWLYWTERTRFPVALEGCTVEYGDYSYSAVYTDWRELSVGYGNEQLVV